MNYTLTTFDKGDKSMTMRGAINGLRPLLVSEQRPLIYSLIAVLVNTGSNLLSPFIIAYIIDTYIVSNNFHGVLVYAAVLLAVYLVGLFASYLQTKLMGGVGRRILFKLRNNIFTKLQELPVAFFQANKSGDLISRINNDTDKLNMFFSQSLLHFVGNVFLMAGAGIFLLSMNIRLGLSSLLPAVIVIIITNCISPWINRRNRAGLQTLGNLSAEIQESLTNFKVVVAFNRLDFFRTKFNQVNQENYTASVKSGVATNILIPIYGIASNAAQIVVLAYGISLIQSGTMTVGVLIGFLLYVNNFYMPLRQLAAIWSSLQLAMASLDRISEVLGLESNLPILPVQHSSDTSSIISFEHVSFSYSDDHVVLQNINFSFYPGKTYALVGPTGGGKTTTASLMARLYDPTSGTIYLNGRDIRSYESVERTDQIGFILQEPFLFTGTVSENILYGNTQYTGFTTKQLQQVIRSHSLEPLLERFDQGLDTLVGGNDSISLGQKQLIAFMRAVLRNPALLILDEATANIDTVTEQLLQSVLEKLPPTTTRVIIAHRLNTIENADEILFVNSGTITPAGSFEHAIEMLMHGQRKS